MTTVQNNTKSVSGGEVCANMSGHGGCGGGSMMTNQDNLLDRKSKLTPMEYRVTQERQTERPFSNKYNKHFEPGSYHCIVCETELFRSDTKFESKSGWPAFSNVVDAKRVKLTPDLSHVGANLLLLVAKPDLARTEVSCANCNAHLGHLFKDGPKPTGLRYCINSSSLTFYPSNGMTIDADTVDAAVVGSLNGSAEENGKPVTRIACSSGQEKICFFQTPSPEPSSRSSGCSNPPKSLMVTSNSSGCLGSKSRWANSDANSSSIVRRRISLFSNPSRPIETISTPPKIFILRETSL